jgi:hypothetical protein
MDGMLWSIKLEHCEDILHSINAKQKQPPSGLETIR